ncbi:MAG: nucleoside triphosphate pyrophosphohydrolase family protein [Minisyncoccia bacterium]
MTFGEYQNKSRKTAIYPDVNNNFVYPTLGLAGEVGEVVEKIKKVIRDKNNIINEETKTNISQEMGDVLWYLAQLATELNLSLEDIAQSNLDKLYSRLERNVLHGSGDSR